MAYRKHPLQELVASKPTEARAHIKAAFQEAGGHTPTAAKAVGVVVSTLLRWVHKLGMVDDVLEAKGLEVSQEGTDEEVPAEAPPHPSAAPAAAQAQEEGRGGSVGVDARTEALVAELAVELQVSKTRVVGLAVRKLAQRERVGPWARGRRPS